LLAVDDVYGFARAPARQEVHHLSARQEVHHHTRSLSISLSITDAAHLSSRCLQRSTWRCVCVCVCVCVYGICCATHAPTHARTHTHTHFFLSLCLSLSHTRARTHTHSCQHAGGHYCAASAGRRRGMCCRQQRTQTNVDCACTTS
jgi:hypothetical protein